MERMGIARYWCWQRYLQLSEELYRPEQQESQDTRFIHKRPTGRICNARELQRDESERTRPISLGFLDNVETQFLLVLRNKTLIKFGQLL